MSSGARKEAPAVPAHRGDEPPAPPDPRDPQRRRGGARSDRRRGRGGPPRMLTPLPDGRVEVRLDDESGIPRVFVIDPTKTPRRLAQIAALAIEQADYRRRHREATRGQWSRRTPRNLQTDVV